MVINLFYSSFVIGKNAIAIDSAVAQYSVMSKDNSVMSHNMYLEKYRQNGLIGKIVLIHSFETDYN